MQAGEDTLTLVREIGERLEARSYVMATAESCTGGGMAEIITMVPGASNWFVGGVVTYANAWKRDCLGVREETLATVGAVSAETVTQMLAGLKDRYGVDAGVAVSGIAGPGGGTPDKPVGTVFCGAFFKDAHLVTENHFSGNREEIREQSARRCFEQLAQLLN